MKANPSLQPLELIKIKGLTSISPSITRQLHYNLDINNNKYHHHHHNSMNNNIISDDIDNCMNSSTDGNKYFGVHTIDISD